MSGNKTTQIGIVIFKTNKTCIEGGNELLEALHYDVIIPDLGLCCFIVNTSTFL